MSKGQTVTKTSHIFSLCHLKNDCYYNSVTADFTPPPRYTSVKLSLNKASNSIVPAYLDDNNFFTPAFIIPRDKVNIPLVRSTTKPPKPLRRRNLRQEF